MSSITNSISHKSLEKMPLLSKQAANDSTPLDAAKKTNSLWSSIKSSLVSLTQSKPEYGRLVNEAPSPAANDAVPVEADQRRPFTASNIPSDATPRAPSQAGPAPEAARPQGPILIPVEDDQPKAPVTRANVTILIPIEVDDDIEATEAEPIEEEPAVELIDSGIIEEISFVGRNFLIEIEEDQLDPTTIQATVTQLDV